MGGRPGSGPVAGVLAFGGAGGREMGEWQWMGQQKEAHGAVFSVIAFRIVLQGVWVTLCQPRHSRGRLQGGLAQGSPAPLSSVSPTSQPRRAFGTSKCKGCKIHLPGSIEILLASYRKEIICHVHSSLPFLRGHTDLGVFLMQQSFASFILRLTEEISSKPKKKF